MRLALEANIVVFSRQISRRTLLYPPEPQMEESKRQIFSGTTNVVVGRPEKHMQSYHICLDFKWLTLERRLSP